MKQLTITVELFNQDEGLSNSTIHGLVSAITDNFVAKLNDVGVGAELTFYCVEDIPEFFNFDVDSFEEGGSGSAVAANEIYPPYNPPYTTTVPVPAPYTPFVIPAHESFTTGYEPMYGYGSTGIANSGSGSTAGVATTTSSFPAPEPLLNFDFVVKVGRLN